MFDRQWRALMQRATERLDLTEVHEALESWRQVAWVTSAHGPEVYRRTMMSAHERLQTGERALGALPWAQLKAELGLHRLFALTGEVTSCPLNTISRA